MASQPFRCRPSMPKIPCVMSCVFAFQRMTRLWTPVSRGWRGPSGRNERQEMKSELRALLLVALTNIGLLSPEARAADRVVHVYNWSDYIDARSLDEFTR